jgi:DNA-binding transcriptional MerR regulator
MTEPATALERGGDKAPDAYRTISEVAHELGLPQHVLRFWESRFGQIRPLKRGGGRRYYKPDDIALLKGIQHLLYNEGYTIKGVQKVLKTQGVRTVQGLSMGLSNLSRPRLKQDNGDLHNAKITKLHDEPDLHIDAEDLDLPKSIEAEPVPLTSGVIDKAIASAESELAGQLPLFNEPRAASPQGVQQMKDFAKRLRAVRESLQEMREQLKKTDE